MPERQPIQQLTLLDRANNARLPAGERPLDRLEQRGSATLSTAELLAIVIGSGSGDVAALQIAHLLLGELGDLVQIAAATQEELVAIEGIGRMRAGKIKASLELGRRILMPRSESPLKVTSVADAASWLIPEMYMLEQEHLCTMLLTTRNTVIDLHTVYIGSLNAAYMRAGELFRMAIRRNAASIVIAHNHPSGDPTPSSEDIRVTRELVKAGKLLSIDVVDHIVIGGHKYVSMRERGLGFS